MKNHLLFKHFRLLVMTAVLEQFQTSLLNACNKTFIKKTYTWYQNKAFFILFTILLLAANTYAQGSDEWTTSINSLNVKISYKVQSCSSQDYIFLKVENNSTDSITLTWDDNISSGTSTFSSENSVNYRRALNIAANQTIQVTCTTPFGTPRSLALPLSVLLNNSYTLATLNYSISNYTKTTH